MSGIKLQAFLGGALLLQGCQVILAPVAFVDTALGLGCEQLVDLKVEKDHSTLQFSLSCRNCQQNGLNLEISKGFQPEEKPELKNLTPPNAKTIYLFKLKKVAYLQEIHSSRCPVDISLYREMNRQVTLHIPRHKFTFNCVNPTTGKPHPTATSQDDAIWWVSEDLQASALVPVYMDLEGSEAEDPKNPCPEDLNWLWQGAVEGAP